MCYERKPGCHLQQHYYNQAGNIFLPNSVEAGFDHSLPPYWSNFNYYVVMNSYDFKALMLLEAGVDTNANINLRSSLSGKRAVNGVSTFTRPGERIF